MGLGGRTCEEPRPETDEAPGSEGHLQEQPFMFAQPALWVAQKVDGTIHLFPSVSVGLCPSPSPSLSLTHTVWLCLMNTAKHGGGRCRGVDPGACALPPCDFGVGLGGKNIQEIVVSSRWRRLSSPSVASTYNILNPLFLANLAFFSELSSFRKPP